MSGTLDGGALSSGALLRQALAMHGQGQWAQMAKLCHQVLAQQPQQADALHMLALAHAQLGDWAEAHTWFERAQQAAPQRGDIRANHVRLWLEAGQPEQALAVCTQPPLPTQQTHLLHTLWGQALLQAGHTEQAIQVLGDLVKAHPALPDARVALGNALHRAGQHQEAIAQYDQALSAQPRMVDALHNKALSLISLRLYAQAESTLQTVLTLQPNTPTASRHLANVSSHWVQPVLGPRFRLQPWCAAHADFLHKCLAHRPFMSRYNRHWAPLQGEHTLPEWLAQRVQAHPMDTRSVNWVIVDTTSGTPLGLAGLTEIDFVHRRAEFMLGLLEPDHAPWGAGLEVALMVMNFAFNTVRLNKLVSIVYAYNREAQANTLELGFAAEGYLREELWQADVGCYQDIHRNGMTQQQFKAQLRLQRLAKRLLGLNIQ